MAYEKRIRIKLSLVVIVYQQVVCIWAGWLVALTRISFFCLQDCDCFLDINIWMRFEGELEMMDDAGNALVLLYHLLVVGLGLNRSPSPH